MNSNFFSFSKLDSLKGEDKARSSAGGCKLNEQIQDIHNNVSSPVKSIKNKFINTINFHKKESFFRKISDNTQNNITMMNFNYKSLDLFPKEINRKNISFNTRKPNNFTTLINKKIVHNNISTNTEYSIFNNINLSIII